MTDASHRRRASPLDGSRGEAATGTAAAEGRPGSCLRWLSPADVAQGVRAATAGSSSLNLPFFGRTVLVSDPALIRQVFMASTDDLINVQPNLSRIFGPGSVFALDKAEHRNRRKLLAPPFHGQSIKNYEKVIEEETLRESANWPEGKEFRTLEPMNRITLNVILRTVFGADGVELDYLRADHPAVGEAGVADGHAARAAAQPRALRPVGPAGGVPPQLRPHRVHADRQGRGRPAFRRARPTSWR